MICDLRQGGQIEVDGELLQEDGNSSSEASAVRISQDRNFAAG